MTRKTDPDSMLLPKLHRGNAIRVTTTRNQQLDVYYYRTELANRKPVRLYYMETHGGSVKHIGWNKVRHIERRTESKTKTAQAGSFTTGPTDGAAPTQAYRPSGKRSNTHMDDDQLRDIVQCWENWLNIGEAAEITGASESVVGRVYRVLSGEQNVPATKKLPARLDAIGVKLPHTRPARKPAEPVPLVKQMQQVQDCQVVCQIHEHYCTTPVEKMGGSHPGEMHVCDGGENGLAHDMDGDGKIRIDWTDDGAPAVAAQDGDSVVAVVSADLEQPETLYAELERILSLLDGQAHHHPACEPGSAETGTGDKCHQRCVINAMSKLIPLFGDVELRARLYRAKRKVIWD
jgi:hypothetical protein